MLNKLFSSGKGSSRDFCTLATVDVHRISLVEQCQTFECEFSTTCYTVPENLRSILAEAKALWRRTAGCWSWTRLVATAHALKHVAKPAIASSWCKTWNSALKYGICGICIKSSPDLSLVIGNALPVKSSLILLIHLWSLPGAMHWWHHAHF